MAQESRTHPSRPFVALEGKGPVHLILVARNGIEVLVSCFMEKVERPVHFGENEKGAQGAGNLLLSRDCFGDFVESSVFLW